MQPKPPKFLQDKLEEPKVSRVSFWTANPTLPREEKLHLFPRFITFVFGVLIGFAIGAIVYARYGDVQSFGSNRQATKRVQRAGPDFIYPPSWVPGAVNESISQDNIKDTICNPLWHTSSIRPSSSYTNQIKIAQLEQMESEDRDLRNFEEDHAIALTIAGNGTDIKNLWPQPYNTQVNGQRVGAKEKDLVEVHLNREVCDGIITLSRAQTIIMQDWYSCYLKIKNKLDCL